MDHLYGGTGRDLLDGGDGYDRLHGGSGADVFRGGAGGDMVLYWGQRKPVTITIGDGPNDGTAGERDDVQGDIEYMSGGKGDDTLIGNDEGNAIYGYGGNDRLVGGPDYDGLWGGEGDDTLDVSGDLDKDGARCGDGLDTLVSDQFDRKPFIGQQCEIFL